MGRKMVCYSINYLVNDLPKPCIRRLSTSLCYRLDQINWRKEQFRPIFTLCLNITTLWQMKEQTKDLYRAKATRLRKLNFLLKADQYLSANNSASVNAK